MAITLGRQLTDDEKDRVVQQHGRVCFATGHTVGDDEPVWFDHIRAFSTGGMSETNNIAPMCAQHNLDKGTLPLFDFRAKLRLEEFFSRGDRLTLGDLLNYLLDRGDISNYGLPINVRNSGDILKVESATFSSEFQLSRCPITGWAYFYATLPIDILGSDDDHDQTIGLQPRYLIFDKVFELFRHFQTSPVLQPSLGRVVNGKIRLFDGQHKAAAILWNDRRQLECKIYVEPDMRLLNQTNISAHEKFAQTRFYTSIMVLKLGSQFGTDFDEYKNLEDGQTKSEAGFVNYLKSKDSLTQGEISKRFRSFLYNSILEDQDNRLARLVAVGNRATDERPITLNGLASSLFASFLFREPVGDNMTTDSYRRGLETENMVKLMNMLDDLGLNQWSPKATKSNEHQLKLSRLVRARFMKAWAELLKDVVCVQLSLNDTDERARPLYRELRNEQLEKIRSCIARLVDWKMWGSPVGTEIDRVRMDKHSMVKDWVREKGLTTGYLMGASE